MNEGFDRIKSRTSFLRFQRYFISLGLDVLADSEFKLWVALLGSANDFDGSNKGQLRVTITKINEGLKWSQGKSSETLNSLISKGFVKRNKNGHYYVAQSPEEVQMIAETFVQSDEQKVHDSEQSVQEDEQFSHEILSYKDKRSY